MTAYPGLPDILKHLFGHAQGQVDESEFRVDIDVTDVLGIQPRLIGNGADDIAGLDLVLMSHFDAVPLPAFRGRSLPLRPGFALLQLALALVTPLLALPLFTF